jgi:hypothetical protein
MGVSHSKESFKNKALDWSILTPQEAEEALEEAEARDEYNEMVAESSINKHTRQPWKPIEAPSEWKTLIGFIKFPEWTAGLTAKIICTPEYAEGGMPHTRITNLICIPINYSRDPTTFERMIVHELVHIAQRWRYDNFLKFIDEFWGYKLPTRNQFEKLPEGLLIRRRINPDTMACPLLVWNNIWVPIIIFNEHITGPRLSSTRLIWWNLKLGKGSEGAPIDWNRMFGEDTNQPEHPFELAAWYLSDSGLSSPAADIIRNKILSILR